MLEFSDDFAVSQQDSEWEMQQRLAFDHTWGKIKRRVFNELVVFDVPTQIDGLAVPQDLRVDLVRFVKHKFKGSTLICLWSINDKQNYIYNVLPENYNFKTDSLNSLSSSALFVVLPKGTNHSRFNGSNGKVDFNYINSLMT